MFSQQRRKRTNNTTRWIRRLRAFFILSVVMTIIVKNREPLLDRIRHFNKRFLNPLMLKMAQDHQVYYAIIEHIGRRSGRKYATPIVIDANNDNTSLFIPLPYGPTTDWCLNVMAAGRCTIRKNGMRYTAVEPQILDAAAALPQIPTNHRRTFKVFGIAKFLTMRIEE